MSPLLGVEVEFEGLARGLTKSCVPREQYSQKHLTELHCQHLALVAVAKERSTACYNSVDVKAARAAPEHNVVDPLSTRLFLRTDNVLCIYYSGLYKRHCTDNQYCMNVNCDPPRALSIQPKLSNIRLATSRPSEGRRLFSKVYPSNRNRNISIVKKL